MVPWNTKLQEFFPNGNISRSRRSPPFDLTTVEPNARPCSEIALTPANAWPTRSPSAASRPTSSSPSRAVDSPRSHRRRPTGRPARRRRGQEDRCPAQPRTRHRRRRRERCTVAESVADRQRGRSRAVRRGRTGRGQRGRERESATVSAGDRHPTCRANASSWSTTASRQGGDDAGLRLQHVRDERPASVVVAVPVGPRTASRNSASSRTRSWPSKRRGPSARSGPTSRISTR